MVSSKMSALVANSGDIKPTDVEQGFGSMAGIQEEVN
jgi:hypothetical protein